ncbi:hypothetical protein B0T19DRAFT_398626 [Cercophora scortea]|uniref:BTB domain-containing protein n=1 Tax=Cercophora scortea TaxID=314031 RepID=A0AAE0MJ21_9PEZI|nr:hypothetical protein B0T19DRAFT_398626 [Cercophora scortea]
MTYDPETMTDESASITDEPETMTDDVVGPVILDEDGDFFLVVEDTDKGRVGEFLVSSKILMLGSRVFRVMLGPNYEEGQRLRQGGRPRIHVKEDDLTAMEIILSIWHMKIDRDINHCQSAETIAAVAILADKYDCTALFRVWESHWNKDNRFWPDEWWTAEDTGYLILAAWLLRDSPEKFYAPRLAVKHLPLNFRSAWKKNKTIEGHLPGKIIAEILTDVQRGFKDIRNLVMSTLSELGKMDTQPRQMLYRHCPKCFRVLDSHFENPKSDKDWCSRCRWFPRKTIDNSSCLPYCSRNVAVAEYLDILRRAGLWPFSRVNYPDSPFSVFDVVDMLRKEKKGIAKAMGYKPLAWDHLCQSGDQCPLVGKLNALLEDMEKYCNGQLWRE